MFLMLLLFDKILKYIPTDWLSQNPPLAPLPQTTKELIPDTIRDLQISALAYTVIHSYVFLLRWSLNTMNITLTRNKNFAISILK